MALTELVKDSVDSRLKSPFFGTVFFAVVALHWETLFYLFRSPDAYEDKVNNLSLMIHDWHKLAIAAAISLVYVLFGGIFDFVASTASEGWRILSSNQKRVLMSGFDYSHTNQIEQYLSMVQMCRFYTYLSVDNSPVFERVKRVFYGLNPETMLKIHERLKDGVTELNGFADEDWRQILAHYQAFSEADIEWHRDSIERIRFKMKI